MFSPFSGKLQELFDRGLPRKKDLNRIFRNYLANGTPSCIVALVTIERIVRGDVRWHSDNFGKGTRNNWRSLAVVHFQSTTRTDYSPVPVRC
jgi:hypothetical protein